MTTQRSNVIALLLVSINGHDAFGRGESDLSEILIRKANQYADQVAGLQSCGGEQRQQNVRVL
jgi:hypothetical protein